MSGETPAAAVIPGDGGGGVAPVEELPAGVVGPILARHDTRIVTS